MKYPVKTILLTSVATLTAFSAFADAPGPYDNKTYLAPLAEMLKPTVKFSRWTRLRDAVAKAKMPPKDGKYLRIARGEIEYALTFAIAGIELKKQGDEKLGNQFIKAAIDTLKSCNRVALEKIYAPNDDPVNGNLGQIAFVLPEVAMGAQLLRDAGELKGKELDETAKMLEIVTDNWIKHAPNPGTDGISNWNNRSGLGPLRVANFLTTQKDRDPKLDAKCKTYRQYTLLAILRGADYPYCYRRLPDGQISPAFKLSGRQRVESPAPKDRIPRFGTSENSCGYNGDAVFNYLNMIAEMPPEEMPQIDEKRMKELCEWLKGWQSLVMPNGAFPSYGDSDFLTGGVDWNAAFEKAAALFADKAKYGDAAAEFKATALAINHFHQKHAAGLSNSHLAKILLASTYRGEVKRASEKSKIVSEMNTSGVLQPAKIILRGNDESKAFAMFQTFYNASHSHADMGCLAAYCVGDRLIQHEFGYDAGHSLFHQMVNIRPAGEEFFPFAKAYEDPAKSLLSKTKNKLGNSVFPYFRSAELKDAPDYAYTKIITDNRFDRMTFRVFRQAVLDKKSGALIVFDTVENINNIKDPIAVSPTWHVQNILKKHADGFVCSDDYQQESLRAKIKTGTPSGPYWIGMKGPEGFTPDSVEWQFESRGNVYRMPAKNHLYLKGIKQFERNEKIGFVSVLMPLDKADITEAPAQISIKNDTADVTVANTCYTISPDGVNAESISK